MNSRISLSILLFCLVPSILSASVDWSVTTDQQLAPPVARDIVFTNLEIVTELSNGDGTTTLHLSVDLVNDGAGRYTGKSGNVLDPRTPTVQFDGTFLESVTVVEDELRFPDYIEPDTTTVPLNHVELIVDDADLSSARDAIAAVNPSEVLSPIMDEVPTYAPGTRILDVETHDAYDRVFTHADGTQSYYFDEQTPLLLSLQAGNVLAIAHGTDVPGFPELYPQDPDNYEKGVFTDPIIIKEVYPQPDGTFEFVTEENTTYEAILFSMSDTVRATFSSSPSTTDTGSENLSGLEPGTLSFDLGSYPLRFNDVEIAPNLRVSGQITLYPTDLLLTYSIRAGSPAYLNAGVGMAVVTDLVVEVDGPVATDPSESTLFTYDLPLAQVPIMGTIPLDITLNLEGFVGASADIPQKAVIPIRSIANGSVEMGVGDDGQPFAEFDGALQPLTVNTPVLYESLASSARAYGGVKVGLGLAVGNAATDATELNPVETTMFFSLKGAGDFDLSPGMDPWWDIDAQVEMDALLELDLLGFQVSETTFPIYQTDPLDHLDASGPLTSDILDQTPLSGNEDRWAVAIQRADGLGQIEPSAVLALPDGGAVIASGTGGFLGRLSAGGDFLWRRNLTDPAARLGTIDAMALTPDENTIVVVGVEGGDRMIGAIDLDGNLLWNRLYSKNVIEAVVELIIQEEEGELFAYAVGRAFFGRADAGTWGKVIKYRIDGANPGDIAWANYYYVETATRRPTNSILGACLNEDGTGLYLVGSTDADALTDSGTNGWVAQIDTDGNAVDSFAIAALYGIALRDIVDAPGSAPVFVGSVGNVVGDGHPRNLIGTTMVTTNDEFKEVMAEMQLFSQDQESAPSLSDTINGGDTGWDTAREIYANEEGFLVVGKTGLGINGPARTVPGSATVVTQFSPAFAPLYMAVYDDPLGGEEPIATDYNGTHLFAYLHKGGRFPFQTDLTSNYGILQKIPATGSLPLHPETGIEQLYISPVVEAYQEHPFRIRGWVETQPMQVEPIGVTELSAPSLTLSPADGFYLDERVEWLDRLQLDSFANYADTYQIDADPDADLDADGIPVSREWVHGLNPYESEALSMTQLSLVIDPDDGALSATIQLSNELLGTDGLESSQDLSHWDPLVPIATETLPVPGFQASEVTYELPPVEGDSSLLLRFQLPETGVAP